MKDIIFFPKQGEQTWGRSCGQFRDTRGWRIGEWGSVWSCVQIPVIVLNPSTDYFNPADTTILFKDFLEDSRQTAARSVLISQKKPVPLNFIPARKPITYQYGKRFYTLVELTSYERVLALLQSTAHFQHVRNVPISSRFLFDTYCPRNLKLGKASKYQIWCLIILDRVFIL